MASIISVPVTGESARLNKGMSSLIRSSGGRSEGLISLTIAVEIEVKNSLNRIAISCGLLTIELLTRIFEIEDDLSVFFFIASLISSQDFFKLLWLERSSKSKNNFLAARKTLLYRFL